MRIYRDVRFSKDKSPYKTNFGIGISANGRKVNEPGYYVHIQPKQNFLGGGYWMPEAEHLKSIRQEIDYNFKDFESVVKEKKFVQFFNTLDESEKLKTLPKGYTADNEAIEYLKLKSFVASTKLSEAEMQNPKLVGLLAERFTTMQPFISFLHSAISV